MIAFSTDSNVAARGVYLLSFLPESDVDRLVGYAAQQGKRSFAAAIPDNPYGTVVEAAFKQSVGRRNGRIVALERYSVDRAQMQATSATCAQAAARPTRCSSPTPPTPCRRWCRRWPPTASTPGACSCSAAACGKTRRSFPVRRCEGAWYAGPDVAGFRNFSGRYRTNYGQDPVRTATLVYDAVALVAALTKTQGQRRFSEEVLTNPSGFTGIDGLFRFRRDGVNQRGLAVMRVSPTGGQMISPRAAVVQRSATLKPGRHAARSATTASSTGNPAGVTRSLPSGVVSTAPSCSRMAMRRGSSGAAGEPLIARGIDAFGEPQAHQQELVGHLRAQQHLVGDDAVAERFDPHQPGFRTPLGSGGVALAVDVEAAMRAGADAGVFVRAPVDEIVPALGAGPRVIGNLVGGEARGGADLLRGVVERAREVLVGHRELAGRTQRGERRVGLDGELIEREMLGGLGERALELGAPRPRASAPAAHR